VLGSRVFAAPGSPHSSLWFFAHVRLARTPRAVEPLLSRVVCSRGRTSNLALAHAEPAMAVVDGRVVRWLSVYLQVVRGYRRDPHGASSSRPRRSACLLSSLGAERLAKRRAPEHAHPAQGFADHCGRPRFLLVALVRENLRRSPRSCLDCFLIGPGRGNDAHAIRGTSFQSSFPQEAPGARSRGCPASVSKPRFLAGHGARRDESS